MSFGALILLSTVCFVAMVSPGPDFVVVTKNAFSLGRKGGLFTALGVVTGCLIHASYCILGLGIILTRSVVLFSTLKLLGACYLIFLGLKALFSKSSEKSSESEAVIAAAKSPWAAFREGFLTNVLNPKLAAFLLSLFTQFISPDAPIQHRVIVAAVFVIESALYWPLLAAALQWQPLREVLRSKQLLMDRVCGGLLVAIGARVAATR